MSKLRDIVEETLIAYGGRSVINVMMFGCDEETEQMIRDYPSVYFLALNDSTCYAPDIIVCANNATAEEMGNISDLIETKFSETVIIEESEGDKLSSKDKASIHQNKYEHFTYFDDNFPNIIVYSQTADITSFVGSSLCVFKNYTGDNVSGVSTYSTPLTNVPFTIVGGINPPLEPDDSDDYLFGLYNKGDEN